MRAKEFIIVENQEEVLDEGLKDIATAGIASLGLMGAPQAPASVPHTPTTMSQAQTQKAPTKQVQKAPAKLNQHEVRLKNAAAKSGIKGTELAQLLAQVKHESWDFTKLKEVGTLKDFAKKYDIRYSPQTAKILGNTKAGDGAKYYGRGYIQLTGKDNYMRAGQALKLDLLKHPELAARPDIAAKVAIWYWKNRVQPRVLNFNNTSQVTKYINSGMAGLEDRHENFKDYLKIIPT